MTINVRIDRLVLHGIALEQGGRSDVGLAVENEIRRQLGEGGVTESLRAGGSRAMVRGADIRADKSAEPMDLGNQIGASVIKGIAR